MNNFLRHCKESRRPDAAIQLQPSRIKREMDCFVALLLAMTILLAFPARADDASLLDIQHIVSDSGVEAWLVEDHSVPVIAMQFSFAGSGAVRNDVAAQGLAQLMSNTMDEGAGDLDAQGFQKLLADHSISLSFQSSRDDFGGALKTLSKNKDQAFALLNLALTAPRFDDEAVARMRKSNQSRIRSSLSNPDWIAARFLNDVAFAGHPYALNSGGTLSSLDAITAQDLQDFHASVIGRNVLKVAVAGDITAAELKAALDNIFGGLPVVEAPPVADLNLKNAGSITVYEKDIPQTIIEIMQRGVDRKDPDYHAAQMMNYVLGSSGFGSRLTEEIREKRGLTYGIYSRFVDMDYFDGLSVSTSTKNENVDEMLSLIAAEFARMRDTGITQEELEDAQAYLIGSLPLSLTSTDRIAGLLLSLYKDDLPIDYLDQREAAIRAMTVDDVNAIAARLLDPNAFVTVLVGQPEGVEPNDIRSEIPNVE